MHFSINIDGFIHPSIFIYILHSSAFILRLCCSSSIDSNFHLENKLTKCNVVNSAESFTGRMYELRMIPMLLY